MLFEHCDNFEVLLMSTSGMGIALEFEEDLRSKVSWVTEETDCLSVPFSE